MKKLFLILAMSSALFTGCRETPAANEGSNPVIDAIMARRSIRHYKDIPVGREMLQRIAECGVNAPNGMNAQMWEVRIIDSPEYIGAVTEIYKRLNPRAVAEDPEFRNMFRNAPAVICVAAKPGKYTSVDCGLMGENMMLAAWSMGLGTCCLGGPANFFKETPECAPFIERLKLGEGVEIVYFLAVGYPDESPEAKPRDLGKIQFIQ